MAQCRYEHRLSKTPLEQTPLVALQRIQADSNIQRNNVVLASLKATTRRFGKGPAALSMIKRAESAGDIKPGDTLIEAPPATPALRGYGRSDQGLPHGAHHAGGPVDERAQTIKRSAAELILTPKAAAWSIRAPWRQMQRDGKGRVLDQLPTKQSAHPL